MPSACAIVPHITLKSIANDEPPAEEIRVDPPEVQGGITRVTGPFSFEAQNKGYAHLYVIGFAIRPNARHLIDKSDAVMNIPATYVRATPGCCRLP